MGWATSTLSYDIYSDLPPWAGNLALKAALGSVARNTQWEKKSPSPLGLVKLFTIPDGH